MAHLPMLVKDNSTCDKIQLLKKKNYQLNFNGKSCKCSQWIICFFKIIIVIDLHSLKLYHLKKKIIE